MLTEWAGRGRAVCCDLRTRREASVRDQAGGVRRQRSKLSSLLISFAIAQFFFPPLAVYLTPLFALYIAYELHVIDGSSCNRQHIQLQFSLVNYMY